MPLFEYKGLSAKGKQVSGLLEADGPAALRSKLQKDGVFVTSFKESGASGKNPARSGGRASAPESGILNREVKLKDMLERVRQQDVAVLTRQFGTLLRAGISMSEALNALVEQQDRPKLKVVLGTIRGKVREGTSLADALAEHRAVFPDLYVNMVRVGEASGTLDVVLERLADFLEAQVKLKSKITSAMIYPILMMCVGLLIVSAMMVFVIPRVAEMFTEMGAELPFLTRVLINMSWVFTHTWFIGIPLTGGAVWWFRKRIQTEDGRWWWDGLKLRMPVFGPMFRMVAVARFGRTLSTLLTSAVPVLSSLDIVRTIVNNTVLAKAIEDAKVAVREGESLAGPLEKSGLFPPMMTHMIAIGEKTGQLEGMLKNVADAYDAEVDSRVSTLTAVLEPVMIVGMGIMVAFLVFAILMPMLKMNEVITGK
jgi:general secretion pathway protein F